MIHQLASLEALLTFVVVGQHQSFSRAARQLHVTPSAVSHRIAALEEELGVQLFRRTTRRVQLTGPARELFAKVDMGLGHINEGVSRILRGTSKPALTLSCSSSFAIRCLLPRIGEFRTSHPELEVHVAADDRLADPRRDDIDVCIRYGAGSYPGMRVERLTAEHVFPVCSVDFRRRHRLRRPEQLTRLPLLHHDVLADHPGRVDWRRWFARAGLEPGASQAGSHFSHAHMALGAALAGEGVALGRTSLVREDLARGRLVTPFGPRVRSGLAYWLVTAASPEGDQATFCTWLKRVFGRSGAPRATG